MKQYLKKKLEETSTFSIVVDFWTGKNSLSYIGVTCTFIENDKKKKELLIGLKYVPSPHTSVIVFDDTSNILREFGIENGLNDSKVFSITTDNGSSMIAAYGSLTDDIIEEFIDSDSETEDIAY